MNARLASLLALAACAQGCGPTAAKREGAALAAAVDAFRRAEGPSRAEIARKVGDVPCTDAQVCASKSACMAAIDPTTRALDLEEAVARRVADVEAKRLAPDSPEAQGLPAKLDDVQRLLTQGRTNMVECDRRLAELGLRN